MTKTQNFQVIDTDGSLIKAWVNGVDFADNARQQLVNIASLPFIFKHVAAMPDVHFGLGATVGSVIATKKAVIPAAVGVDIGCGMMAVKTELTANDLPDNLKEIRSLIEAGVPHGRTSNGGRGDRGAWGKVPFTVTDIWEKQLKGGFDDMRNKHPKLQTMNDSEICHLGTLGTGNHFIEVCLDENDQVWVMLHSGSRGFGNKIGRYFIDLAKRDMEKWFINLPDKDLSYLVEGTDHFEDYWEAVNWAQNWAHLNRQIMMTNVLHAMNRSHGISRNFWVDLNDSEVAVNCHHNYVSREAHFGDNVIVTRKGAVRAREGDLGIIPGSMGARSYIVSGRGNDNSFHSCSHGAGRVMSRGQAKREITAEQHLEAVQHVECRKDDAVRDESPAAYKDIDAVMAAQSDLVEIVHTLRQVVCVKG